MPDELWDSLADTTDTLWQAHNDYIETILPFWYRHVVKQVQVSNTQDLTHESFPKSLLAHIRPEGIAIEEMETSDSISGLLFTGPIGPTFLVARSHNEGDMHLTMAHLISHYRRGHVQRGYFDIWIEYEPGVTPEKLQDDIGYIYAEELADDEAISFLEPRINTATFLPGGRRFIIACIELGIPKMLLSALLWLRTARRAEPLVLRLLLYKVQRQFFGRPIARYSPGPGALVCGHDRHVYLLDAHWHKHWIPSKRLLYASRYPKFILQVPDKLLISWERGPHIYDIETLQRMQHQLLS